MSDDFLDLLDGPKRPDIQHAPGPVTRDATAYGRAALAGEIANIKAVEIGSGRNDQLNRSAVKMGGLVAAGAIDEQTVIEELGEADGGLHYKATRDTIRSGLTFGMQQARAVPDREAPSSTPDFGFGDSSDPFSASFTGTAGPSPSTAATGLASSPFAAGGDALASRSETPNGFDAESSDALGDYVREHLPLVDWLKAWNGPSEVEWIVEPLLPARRLVAIYSPPKVGKSLLMLELALNIARGTVVLGVTPARAYRVLYVDFENDLTGDIVPRLQAMGAEPTFELDNLCYLTLPTLAGLDTERGARELLAAIKTYRCEVVVIDTVSRSVDGEENENDTWLKFYRQTGLRLKQAGVAMIRLDHTGKDEAKGQRGGSAKEGDVDAVWKLSRTGDELFKLVCDMSRFPIPAADKILNLKRVENPLRHVLDLSADTIVEQAVKACDDAGIDNTAGWRPVQKTAAEAGVKIGERLAIRAAETRKKRENHVVSDGS